MSDTKDPRVRAGTGAPGGGAETLRGRAGDRGAAASVPPGVASEVGSGRWGAGANGPRGGARPGGTDGRGDDPRSRTPSRLLRGDRGQVALEYLGFLPALLLVGLAGLQLGLASYAAQQAGTAARAAARAASSDADDAPAPGAAARAAVSGWLTVSGGDPVEGDGEVTVSVSVDIPQVVPFWDLGTVTEAATMPLPQVPEEDEVP
ncbi:TadE/TadG family type IV pilus assembly protein [Streptomyces hydrogenans]|uniref:TadE/TadG family type IV pilus assembly protein n=1 Tax=Streptomyces hydrogenans TaxID=1873719 RepID=UPI003800A489